MNYYSDQEIAQVIEEGNRQPLPATQHVALVTVNNGKPKKDRTALKAWGFGLTWFALVMVVTVVDVPGVVLAVVAGLLITVFAVTTMRGNK